MTTRKTTDSYILHFFNWETSRNFSLVCGADEINDLASKSISGFECYAINKIIETTVNSSDDEFKTVTHKIEY